MASAADPDTGMPGEAARAPAVASLRTWLAVLVLGVALPLLLLAGVLAWREHRSAVQRLELQMQLQARSLAAAVDSEFAAATAIARTLAHSTALAQGRLADFRAEIDAAVALAPQLIIGLADRQGMLVLTSLLPRDARPPPGTRANDAVLAAVTSGGVAIGDLYRGAISGRLQVPVAAPSPDGGHAVSVILPDAVFAGTLAAPGYPPGWVVAILDRQNRLAARTPGPGAPAGAPAPSGFATGAPADSAGVAARHGLDGVAVAVALARAPVSGFTIALSLPRAAFNRPIIASLLWLLGLGLPLTLLGCLLAMGLGRRIVDAIGDLAAPGTRATGRVQFREIEEIAVRLATAERWRVALMREMNHRVKNTLMTVQALAAQTLKGAPCDPDRFQREFSARLASLSRAHDLLTAIGWQAAGIEAVVAAALAPWQDCPDQPIRILGGEHFEVGARQAQALVLALHELATNAAKHGALSRPEGRVRIGWARAGAGMATLRWSETGAPPLAGGPQHVGFGSRLLTRILPQELGQGATVERIFAPAGLQAVMRFAPLTLPAAILP